MKRHPPDPKRRRPIPLQKNRPSSNTKTEANDAEIIPFVNPPEILPWLAELYRLDRSLAENRESRIRVSRKIQAARRARWERLERLAERGTL